jgi:hypothetical protein
MCYVTIKKEISTINKDHVGVNNRCATINFKQETHARSIPFWHSTLFSSTKKFTKRKNISLNGNWIVSQLCRDQTRNFMISYFTFFQHKVCFLIASGQQQIFEHYSLSWTQVLWILAWSLENAPVISWTHGWHNLFDKKILR